MPDNKKKLARAGAKAAAVAAGEASSAARQGALGGALLTHRVSKPLAPSPKPKMKK
tara:strand:- start:3035 stop:3202 length:168 start_codon:yes stop_codon:yes gene_type:complete